MAPGMEPYGSVNDFGPLITVACTDKWPDMRPVIRSSTEGVAAPPERGSQGKTPTALTLDFSAAGRCEGIETQPPHFCRQ